MMNVTAFEAERPRLIAIATRILGSSADADDVLQDAWLRQTRSTNGTNGRLSSWPSEVFVDVEQRVRLLPQDLRGIDIREGLDEQPARDLGTGPSLSLRDRVEVDYCDSRELQA